MTSTEPTPATSVPPWDADWALVALPPPAGPLRLAAVRVRVLLLRWACAAVLRLRTVDRAARAVQQREPRARWSAGLVRYAVERVDRAYGVNSRSSNKCLLRSLVVCALLRRGGYAPVLNIGLAVETENLGHAWVSVGPEVVWEATHQWRSFSVPLHREGGVAYWVESPG